MLKGSGLIGFTSLCTGYHKPSPDGPLPGSTIGKPISTGAPQSPGASCQLEMALGRDLTWTSLDRFAKRSKRLSQLCTEEFRLFPGGEVTASIDLVEVGEIAVG